MTGIGPRATTVAWDFEAIGAPWQVETARPLAPDVRQAVLDVVDRFDRTWSRFRDDSVVTAMAGSAGAWSDVDSAGLLLDLYDGLHRATDGSVTPLVGQALVDLGYDADYSLVQRAEPAVPDDWAALGYLAIAPDIFWRFAAGVELSPDIESEFQEALGYFGQYDADLGVKDIEAAIRWLRSQGATKVGCVGFCLGGRLAYMAATRTDIDASVGYYGVMIDTMLNEAHAIAKPLMLHIPTEDHFVDHAAQAKIHEALDPNPKVRLHDYPGLDHGFAATMGNRRNDDGAQLADSRTRDFFAQALA